MDSFQSSSLEGLGSIKADPLSDADIRKILGRGIKILTYPQVIALGDIRKAFDKQGRCIMLYLTESETSGHWVCMLLKKGEIEFFDPYGEPPEAAFKNVPEEEMEEFGQEKGDLTQLMRQSGLKVIYNTYPFQKDKADVNTCGRHAVVRCLYAPYSLQKYKASIDKSKMSPDDFVSALTAQKLGK